MIGPHEGEELELMLSGQKDLAVFYDYFTPDQAIAEQIIPEKAFAPHVASGTILRFEQVLFSPKAKREILYVCFTTPKNEWRAKAFFWIKTAVLNDVYEADTFYELYVGRLLGYQDADIYDFISKK